MKTRCRIKWVDDNSEEDVFIKETHDIGADDDEIFFYGMSRDKCINAMKSQCVCEGEWVIIEVYD